MFSSGFVTVSSSNVYIFGGADRFVSNKLYQFSFENFSITQILYTGNVPGLMYPNLLKDGNLIYLIGGYNVINEELKINSKIYKLSLDSFSWTEFILNGKI